MDRVVRICEDCQAQPKKPHRNSKYCETCSDARRRIPVANLTPHQEAHALSLINEIPHPEIAKQVGISLSTLRRWLRNNELHSNCQKYAPEIIMQVIDSYVETGKTKTAELFPGINVRSIVERYDHAPRQTRWKENEIIEAARMAGLVSRVAQSRYFDRPHAASGSIRALWARKFKCVPSDVNGVAGHVAWNLAMPGAPATLVKHNKGPSHFYQVLWLDLALYLKPNIDPWVRHTIETLAKFQSWLHGTDDTAKIREMILERELQYGPRKE